MVKQDNQKLMHRMIINAKGIMINIVVSARV
jgi:hypothetical protein